MELEYSLSPSSEPVADRMILCCPHTVCLKVCSVGNIRVTYSIDPEGINNTGNIRIIIPLTNNGLHHHKNYTR